MHNRRVQSDTIDLIERVRSRLRNVDQPCAVAGPASEESVAAAEEQLGCAFPPSYRAFLRKYGALALPGDMAVVHDFVGIDAKAADGKGVVERTLAARVENRLGQSLVVVGLGAQAREWFCLDYSRSSDPEPPVVLFDTRDNHVDQVFYEDFGAMVREVLGFVEDTLNHQGGEASVG